MRSRGPLATRLLTAITVAAIGALLALGPNSRPAAGASLGQLNAALSAEQAHQQALSASVARTSAMISSLSGQIALVRQREADVRAQLSAERVALARTRRELLRARLRLAMLRARLARARAALARQLVSGYERPQPDLVDVVLEAHGFSQLLDELNFLGDAEHQQQQLIALTRRAKAQAAATARRLAALADAEQQEALAAAQRVQALAGMNELLGSRELALAHARAAQEAALAASQARGRELENAIAQVRAEQAAAARAAAAAAASAASQSAASGGGEGPSPVASSTAGTTSAPTPAGPTFSGSGGWAIPYAVVLCESGGQDLTPNSAGASGYYQILPSTWKEYGGTGPAAYLASKAEQDAVASRIWAGGSGASAWVCAQKLGYAK